MSSGTDLLRQLVKQQRRQTTSVSKKATALKPPASNSCSEEAAAGGGSTRSSQILCSITVCTGSNCGAVGSVAVVLQPSAVGCAGSGTSATLLEIEELVQEEFAGVMTVQSGGCTDHCTMGPNVFVRTLQQDTTRHLTKVNSVEACAKVVVLTGTAKKELPSSPSSSTSSSSMLLRRAEGLRWKALREIAREKIRANGTAGGRDLLNQAVDAEIAALRSDPERVARAERRRHRLLAVLETST